MMRLMGSFIFGIFSNAIAILVAANFVSGFIFTGDFVALVITAAVLTVANLLLRPILKLLLGPLIVLTFGLFTLVINAVILYLLDIFIEPLTIQGYLPLLWATIITSAVNLIINLAAKFLYRK